MTRKSLPRKSSAMWIGLAFALAAIVVVGYHWYSQNRELKVAHERQKGEIRKKLIKNGDQALSPGEAIRRPGAEKPVSSRGRGDKPADRGKGGSVRSGRRSMVASDNKPGKFTERGEGERLAESTAADSDRETSQESGISAEAEMDRDEPDYSDAQPPEVIAIVFDPQQVPPGTNVSIYVQATDNLSGVKSISGMARSPSGAAALPFGCRRSGSDESFVGTLAIPERAEMGRWYLAYLRITDEAYNSKTYSQNALPLADSYFEVVESDSDNVPPEVTAVYLNPLEVDGGGQVQVTVEAKDDKSGVAKISGALMSPSKYARLSFSCRNEGETNVFYGQLTIPEDAETGQWTLDYIRAEDGAKNVRTFYRTNYPSMFDNASIHVYTNNSDSQPPTLENLMIYPSSVAYGETAKIIVDASDDISGIRRISGRLQSPSGKATVPFSCVYNPDSQDYEAAVILPANAEIGPWGVNYIRIIDEARNQIDYSYDKNPLVQQAVLEITGE